MTERSTDIGTDLDLSPRAPAAGGATSKRRRSVRNLLVIGVVVAALGFVVFQALTSARVYFLNVDEAVAQRAELGDEHFRMQGAVVETTGVDETGALRFTLAFGEASAEVRHIGDEPSGLFELGQNVVVDGYWDGATFVSRQVLVKHSEAYVEANPDRFDDSSGDGATANIEP